MTIAGLLQARYCSSRLPGKVLMPLAGEPMLARQLERLKRASSLDTLIVATSNDPSDDPIEKTVVATGYECYRGDIDDVLDRMYRAALPHYPDHVVRLTGDCPLADPELIDKLVMFHLGKGADYSSLSLNPTFPDGLDAEVIRFGCLEEAWREASLPSEREHVTPFIHTRPDRYSIASYESDVDLSHLRWTVDEKADYDLVSIIYDELYEKNPAFTTGDIVLLLERKPSLATYNTSYKRNEGYEISLKADAKSGGGVAE